MQRKFITTYLFIFAALLAVMSLSRSSTEKIRGGSVATASPFWEKVLSFKHFILHPFQPSPFSSLSLEEEKLRLQVENQLLLTENSWLQKQLGEQLLLASQIAQTISAYPEKGRMVANSPGQTVHKKLNSLEKRLQALPARVIFRSFDSWHQSLWINAGESSNQKGEDPAVALNSPVVVGNAIVGIIDYVGKNQSRVRLITDSRLNPSVRASRGGEQDFLLNEQIESLLQQISLKKQIPLSPNDHTHLYELLTKLKEGLQPFKRTWYLAKGELNGSPSSSRIGQSITLTGTGFNYDFPDDEGENRDLRSGKSLLNQKEAGIPILKINDILVTTGMDGVFPPGFQTAIVTRIGLLKEGDYFYELEARPIAGPLEELSLVFVLPPLKKENTPTAN